MMKYYEVVAKCGHVGKTSYIFKSFYVPANSKKEASDIVTKKGRVKHHDKKRIKSIKEISIEEYLIGVESNKKDPYFNCKNIQEQRIKCVGIEYEKMYEEELKQFEKQTHTRNIKIYKEKLKEAKKEIYNPIYD